MAELKDILNPGSDPEIHSMKIGTGSDYTEIQGDGSIIYYGASTVWDDMTSSLIANRLSSTVGKLNYNYEENTVTMQSGGSPTNINDRLTFNFQKPHKAKQNSEFRLHIHWEQVNSNQIEWQTDYRIQHNNQIKTTEWTAVIANSVDDSVFTYPGTGIFNQITNLAQVDLTLASLSATVQFRITRIDITTGDIEAVFIDAHFESDSDGSRQEFIK